MYRQLLDIMDRHEKKRFFQLMVLIVFVSIAEVVGLSSVLLLLAVLTKPEIIDDHVWLNTAREFLGLESALSFQITLALVVMAVFIGSLGMRALGAYASMRFSIMRSYSFSTKLLSAYLHQPYHWFLSRNTAEISTAVLGEVEQVVARVLQPGTKMLASVALAASIIFFLFLVDPLVCLVAGVVVSGSYGTIFIMTRHRIRSYGAEMVRLNRERFRLAAEASGGFKEVKLMGLEDSYNARFQAAARKRAKRMAFIQLLSTMPRFALEGVAFGTLLILIFILILRNDGNLVAALPTLGIFAFSTMRLMPAVQQIFGSLNAMRGASAALDKIHEDFMESRSGWEQRPVIPEDGEVLRLKKSLKLEHVHFSYPSAARTALNDLDLTVDACTTIGLVGSSGAGKTTTVDVLLGLLQPDQGRLVVDGQPITRENIRAWQRTIGYVPQSIYLTDDTVAANIAFGVQTDAIDQAAVERAARMAHLHDFVVGEMSDGYDTLVGERGVRLSGGQRQRVGIARALYHNPSLIVMDEATSALDNITERIVMEAVNSIREEKTIILIAHRLTTVQGCDRIYLMDNGRIIDSGTYDELYENSDRFRAMALGAA